MMKLILISMLTIYSTFQAQGVVLCMTDHGHCEYEFASHLECEHHLHDHGSYTEPDVSQSRYHVDVPVSVFSTMDISSLNSIHRFQSEVIWTFPTMLQQPDFQHSRIFRGAELFAYETVPIAHSLLPLIC